MALRRLYQTYRKIKYSQKWRTNRLLVLVHPLFKLVTRLLIFTYQKVFLPAKRSRPGRLFRTSLARIRRLASRQDSNSAHFKKARIAARLRRWKAAERLYIQALGEENSRPKPRLEYLNEAAFNLSVIKRLANLSAYQDQIKSHQQDRSPRRIAIYTAISGDYDTIKLPEVLLPGVDYYLFTDKPESDAGVFKIRPLPYYHIDTPRMTRYAKTHPHHLLADYDVAIWIDANILITGDITPLIDDFIKSKKAVGAIQHPLRNSLDEEAEACIARSKEDEELIREQLRHYQDAGYKTDELIESNIMMFDLKNHKTRNFLTTWWSEIDSYTRRDQLSLNYSLDKHEIRWHRIMERPHDARNHPLFALVPHSLRQSSIIALNQAVGGEMVDPYAGKSFKEARNQIIKAQAGRHIDVVYCVHNALEDVKLCLASVLKHRRGPNMKLIIVDDGSDQPTASFLKSFHKKHGGWVTLLRNESGSGYTKAANQGLKATTGEMAILLNSDTIVTAGWTEKMAAAVFSTPGAGIVGPLSSAASHQSIPNHIGSGNQTATNELPKGLSADEINRNCEAWAVAGLYPRVPLIHGFCFGVTREVIETVGYFDEQSFPRGYGEENDYCFRAVDAGFSLVIATNTYIFHAKSKSYQDDQRVALMQQGNQKLRELRGKARIERAIKSVLANPILKKIRNNTDDLYQTFDRS